MPSKAKRYSIQQIAADSGIPERKLRRTTRSMELGVGRGKRYTLTTKQRNALLKRLGA